MVFLVVTSSKRSNCTFQPDLMNFVTALSHVSLRVLIVSGILGSATTLAEPYGIVVMQGLDKVTARISTFDAPVGVFIEFGTLQIIARTCDKRPPEETPESAAFLDISEVRPGEPTVTVYRGWMFASSPGLSALEHPVYDIWVLDCGGEVLSGDVPIVPPAGRGGQGPKLPDLEKLFKLNN